MNDPCFICGEQDESKLWHGVDFSRKTICRLCLDKSDQEFIKDMNIALYGNKECVSFVGIT